MNKELATKVGEMLIQTGNKIKAGNSELTEEEAMDVMRIIVHEPIGREEVCKEMNINNTKFYDLMTLNKIPKGRKRRSFKELYWYRDEIRDAIIKLRSNR